MNLTMLRYFQAVAKSEQMTKTAGELRIAQPALSRSIKKLEEEVGTPLFNRRNNRLILNAAGRIMLQAANHIINAWEQALADVHEATDTSAHQIVMNVSSAGILVPKLIQKFREIHPETSFVIHGHYNQFWDNPICDLFVFASIQESPFAYAHTLYSEPLYLTVCDRHPLAKEASISLKACRQLPFLFSDENNDMYRIQMYYCHLAGFSPSIEIKTEKQNILLNLLQLNQGVTLLPELSADSPYRHIVQIPINDFICRRYIHVMLNPQRPHSTLAEQFQSFCVDYFSQQDGGAP